VQERVFPNRRLRRKTQETDRVAFQAKCNELRLHAAGEERTNPVSFGIGNSWTLSEQISNTSLNVLHGV